MIFFTRTTELIFDVRVSTNKIKRQLILTNNKYFVRNMTKNKELVNNP